MFVFASGYRHIGGTGIRHHHLHTTCTPMLTAIFKTEMYFNRVDGDSGHFRLIRHRFSAKVYHISISSVSMAGRPAAATFIVLQKTVLAALAMGMEELGPVRLRLMLDEEDWLAGVQRVATQQAHVCAAPGAVQSGGTAGRLGGVSVEVSAVQRTNQHTQGHLLQEQDWTGEAGVASILVGDGCAIAPRGVALGVSLSDETSVRRTRGDSRRSSVASTMLGSRSSWRLTNRTFTAQSTIAAESSTERVFLQEQDWTGEACVASVLVGDWHSIAPRGVALGCLASDDGRLDQFHQTSVRRTRGDSRRRSVASTTVCGCLVQWRESRRRMLQVVRARTGPTLLPLIQ